MTRLDTRSTSCSATITLVASALLGLGVVMVFSASASLTAAPITTDPLRNPSVRQAAFSFIALVVMLWVSLYPYRRWEIRDGASFQWPVILMLVTAILLLLVLIPGIGEIRNGARRWFSLGPAGVDLGFQPSEVAKLSIVLFLAGVCAKLGKRLRRFWSGFLPTVAIVGIAIALVGVEDFGTAALLAVVTGGVLLASRARLRHVLLVGVPTVAAMTGFVLARPYRVARLLTFLDPYADPQGRGYHQIQSLIAIASGGWSGHGLGAGIQKYGYLPEGRSDFIFAVVCEELGVIGGAALIALFLILLWQGRRAMSAAPSEFGRLLALGATLTIGIQAAMNIAVVTVTVPTKGIALPLVSAGGTGDLVFGVMLGLLISVARDCRSVRRTPSPANPSRTPRSGGRPQNLTSTA
ncbi:MAG: FtsW/RodA/SpoVE family cell cycle protein [Phycisphaerae bacterium]